ncbi:MAG: DUF1456 family protein [Xanthomonadales bacterium]|nr:DUF1456 family protein [Xanthomonadales bacterium]
MTNNDILRRIRYTLDMGDDQVIEVFAQGDLEVTREQVCNWLKREEDPDYRKLKDPVFAAFLNGLINARRGKKEGAPRPVEQQLDNNAILMKLKIAFNLQAQELQAIMKSGGLSLSKHELSAFFRKAGHKHHRELKDQGLRSFLKGIQKTYRGA